MYSKALPLAPTGIAVVAATTVAATVTPGAPGRPQTR